MEEVQAVAAPERAADMIVGEGTDGRQTQLHGAQVHHALIHAFRSVCRYTWGLGIPECMYWLAVDEGSRSSSDPGYAPGNDTRPRVQEELRVVIT